MAMFTKAVLMALCAFAAIVHGQVTIPHTPVGHAPPLPLGTPHPPPPYMKDNINNFFGVAPDAGFLTGPVLTPLNASLLDELHSKFDATIPTEHIASESVEKRAGDGYWLSTAGPAGKMPFAPSGYQFFRNVKDFGAKGDGVTDDTAAINRAAALLSSGSSQTRCGASCGSTTTEGAVVYFPPGTYIISTPIIQYYYTSFVGNAYDKPIIRGSFNFTGIALFDSDFYIPGGSGAEWYINQSNFYRQVRNFIFDMTAMNWTNYDHDQAYVPAGIHWQVGQATSITYCDFNMSTSTATQRATAIGIYMENGSGGFVSDLTFTGGNIGFLAGSQQFTSNNLQFTSCLTAISQVWNWGFVWKNIYILSCYVAIDMTAFSGVTYQGTGSVSVIDSHFNGVPYAITLAQKNGEQPNIVLDNLLVENSQSVVLVSGGATILPGSSGAQYFNSWASGYEVLPDYSGGKRTGFLNPAPNKPAALLDSNGAYFTRSKPQYPGMNVISATDNGIQNDGTGDQTSAINTFLSANVGSLLFFPAGVYQVSGTVKIPVGSKIVGSAWSQIMGTGTYFQDASNPKVMVQVGNAGDSGVIELSEMLFTVKGPTAGAILMEWNVHESSQGSAAMWDCHFRVGGASNTSLQLSNCPIGGTTVNKNCMAATMMLHVTSQSSGYFENVWAWTADHDLDNPANAEAYETTEGIPMNVHTDVSVYVGRGMLIESQGPSWFYGTASEHAQLYQYQLSGANNIYMGHMQTETPYYQPNPVATSPFSPGQFPSDPTFSNCATDKCKSAWALRVVNSTNIYIYSGGFYSFFENNQLGCTNTKDCQLSTVDTSYSQGLWMYNIFTLGNIQIISPESGGQIPPLLFNATTEDGYTSEVAAWLALALGGGNLGSGNSSSGSGIITIDPDLWTATSSATVQCTPPCSYVLPPLTLPSDTTFSFPALSTTYEVGYNTTTTFTYLETVTTTTYVVTSVISTVITVPAVTTSVISWYGVNVTANTTVFSPIPSITQTPIILTDPSTISSSTLPSHSSIRTYYPPPWPGSTLPPCISSSPPCTPTPTISSSKAGSTTVHHTSGPPKPTCTHVTGCGNGGCGNFLNPCLPCWFCSGLGFINCPGCAPPPGSGPDGGSGGDDGGDDDCETATYSSCSTFSIGTSSTSTCKDVVGCDTTGTDIATGFTAAPAETASWENWYDEFSTFPDSVVYSAASQVYKTYGTLGVSATTTSTTSTTTTSTQPPWPTNTAENVGDAYCFKSSDGYVQFSQSDAQTVIQSFCAANHVLTPGQTFAYSEEYTDGNAMVFATAQWATNQAGCGTEQDFAFNANSDECLEGWSTDYFCGNENGSGSQPTSFGGGYVLNPNDEGKGCILVELFATAANSKRSIHPPYNSTTTVPLNLSALIQAPGAAVIHNWGRASGDETANLARLFSPTLLQNLTHSGG